jgi:hypothetical protein
VQHLTTRLQEQYQQGQGDDTVVATHFMLAGRRVFTETSDRRRHSTVSWWCLSNRLYRDLLHEFVNDASLWPPGRAWSATQHTLWCRCLLVILRQFSPPQLASLPPAGRAVVVEALMALPCSSPSELLDTATCAALLAPFLAQHSETSGDVDVAQLQARSPWALPITDRFTAAFLEPGRRDPPVPIRRLSLRWCDRLSSARGIEPLLQLAAPSLTVLDLSHTFVTDATMVAFFQWQPPCLAVVDLSATDIGGLTLGALLNYVWGRQQPGRSLALRQVDLRHCCLLTTTPSFFQDVPDLIDDHMVPLLDRRQLLVSACLTTLQQVFHISVLH